MLQGLFLYSVEEPPGVSTWLEGFKKLVAGSFKILLFCAKAVVTYDLRFYDAWKCVFWVM